MKEQPLFGHQYGRVVLIFFMITSWSLQVKADTTTLAIDTLQTEQHYSIADTTSVIHKKFSAEEIKKLKSDSDLTYNHPPTVAENLWSRFKRWISELIYQLFTDATAMHFGKLMAYLAGAALIIYLLMIVLKVNAYKIFAKGGDAVSPYPILHENIHQMDFEKLIEEATRQKDFRVATRMLFLYSLKILSDRQLIDWNTGKTNYDYVQELQHPELKEGFLNLSLYFDYAWYGNFNITPEIFRNMQTLFDSWKIKVNR